MYDEFKDLDNDDLEQLIKDLKNEEDYDTADEVLKDFCDCNDFEDEDFKEYLAVECNCCMCARCGRYFGEDELSSNDEDCIYCWNNEAFYEYYEYYE